MLGPWARRRFMFHQKEFDRAVGDISERFKALSRRP